MKDFVGNEISVGDFVVGCVAHGRNSGASLTKGHVTRITEKTVFFEAMGYTQATHTERERKIDPNKVIVISKKEQS